MTEAFKTDMTESGMPDLSHVIPELLPETPKIPFIKICGLTRLEDALLAAELGANALGFVFYAPSPRATTLEAIAPVISSLTQTLPKTQGEKLWKVGVFVNAGYEEMVQTAEKLGLTHLQLHGTESPVLCQRLQNAGFQVIKALRLKHRAELVQLEAYPEPILLDAAIPGIWGGSGQLADWDLAALAAQQQQTILAGGLNPDNIQAALAAVKPWGLDLSSGLESAPGIKKHQLMQALFMKARPTHANPD
jgi:phosphoribosylanthranilate isomerase